jgi:ClpP class serine protease
MNKVGAAIADRAMRMAACLDPRAGAAGGGGVALRELVARWVKGDGVELSELRKALPSDQDVTRLPTSLRMVYDWRTDEVRMTDAYRPLNDTGTVGLMEVAGPIMLRPDLFEMLFFGVVPQDMLVQALDLAAKDAKLETLCIAWHTPGGSVGGLYEVTAAMDRLKAAGKRVVSLASEAMLSAGVFFGCMADEVVTTPTALVGSVGTFGGVYFDLTGMLEADGVEAHVIASHPRKAVGYFGAPVTEDLLDDAHRRIATHAEEFFAHVAAHRGLSVDAVRAMEARIYCGHDVVEAGLADRVVPTARGYLEELVAGGGGPKVDMAPTPRPAASKPDKEAEPENTDMNVKGATLEDLSRDCPALVDQIKGMALETAKPKAATVIELEAAFPGEDKFVLAQVKAGASIDSARGAFAMVLAERLAQQTAATTQAQARVAELEKLNGAGKGGEAVKTNPGAAGGAGAAAELGPAPGPKASNDERKAFAKKEWDADVQGCRSSGGFANEAAYIADRAYTLKKSA